MFVRFSFLFISMSGKSLKKGLLFLCSCFTLIIIFFFLLSGSLLDMAAILSTMPLQTKSYQRCVDNAYIFFDYLNAILVWV